MITIPRMAKVLRKVFESDARDLARSMGVIQRERKLNATTLALVLVLGWLHHPQAGSSALARFAGTLGVQTSRAGDRRALDLQDGGVALRGVVAGHWLYAQRQSGSCAALGALRPTGCATSCTSSIK
jgi:hypothetical protein